MHGRITAGLIIIFFGVIFLLQNLLGINSDLLISLFWPLVLIILGIVSVVKHRMLRTGAVILILIGIWFELRNLDIISGRFSESLWPLIIIFIGIMVIINHNHPHYHYNHHSGKTLDTGDNDFVNYSGVFCEYNVKNLSQSFKGGDISGVFGSLTLDFSEIKIAGDTAVLDVAAVFGSVDITVPTNCRLRVDSTPVLGSCRNSAMNNSSDISLPLLHLKCTATFGNVDIHN